MDFFQTRKIIRLRQDGVYIERDDQRWSCYDGVESWSIVRERLAIELNPKGLRALECRRMVVELAIDDLAYESFCNGLVQLFEGSAPCATA